MKKILPLLFITFLLGSCESPVTFEEAQPADTKTLSEFPKNIRGKYINETDSSILTIDNKKAVLVYEFQTKMPKNELDSGYSLQGDFIINTATKEKIHVVIKGDTLLQQIHGTDTLFAISQNNVLKKFKGYYFLNSKDVEKSWQVKKLFVEKRELTIGSINSKEDLNNLKVLTETTNDTTKRNFNLSRKQFKKFVKEGGFKDESKFWKIN